MASTAIYGPASGGTAAVDGPMRARIHNETSRCFVTPDRQRGPVAQALPEPAILALFRYTLANFVSYMPGQAAIVVSSAAIGPPS